MLMNASIEWIKNVDWILLSLNVPSKKLLLCVTQNTNATKSDSTAAQLKPDQPKPATVKVTKEYDFAGETVT